MPPRGRVERTRAPPRRSAASRCPSPNTPRTPACDRATSLPRSNAREPTRDVSSRAVVARRRRLARLRVSQSARPFQSSSRRRRARSTRTTPSRGRATTRARRRTEDGLFLRLARCAREDARARSASRSRDIPRMNEKSSRHPATRLALDASRAGRRSRGHRSRAGWTLASRAATRARTRRGINPARVPVVIGPNTIIGNGRIRRR